LQEINFGSENYTILILGILFILCICLSLELT